MTKKRRPPAKKVRRFSVQLPYQVKPRKYYTLHGSVWQGFV